MKKSVLIIAAGVVAGYVLGARFGRATTRYAREQVPVIRDRAQSVGKDVADRTVSVAKDLTDRTATVAKDAADKTTTVARDVRDRTVTAAADAASRVGEARDDALEDFDDDDSGEATDRSTDES